MAKKVSGGEQETSTAEVIELHPDPEAPAEENLAETKSNVVTLTGTVSGVKPSEHRVLITQTAPVKYEQLYLGVYLTGNETERKQFAELFALAGCWKADRLDEADMVVFAGGADVDPSLYSRTRHGSVTSDARRDVNDIKLYNYCLDEGIFMFGVCRGLQFLHVMNGGTPYQHVDNHNREHSIYDKVASRTVSRASSVHHQMVRDDVPNMQILATARESRHRWSSASSYDNGPHEDIEAVFYRETGCLGVQGHPEYKNYPGYTKWCIELIQSHFSENPDFSYEGSVQRMKFDLIKQRRAERKAAGILPGLRGEAIDFVKKYGPMFDNAKKG